MEMKHDEESVYGAGGKVDQILLQRVDAILLQRVKRKRKLQEV